MLALDAAYAIEETIQQLEAIKKADPKVIQIETRMTRALRTRFRIIHQATAQALEDMGRIPHADVQVITAPLTAGIADLQKIVSTHAGTAAEMGRARIKTHLRKKKKPKKSGKSFAEKEAHPGANAGAGAAGSYSGPMETGPAWNKAKQKIIDKAISSTDDSWHRMTDDITNCLSDAYENKLTLDQTKAQLGTVMDNMEGYELERIARTIVNGAQNAASADTINELGLDYQQWWTSLDDRVRGMDPKDSADHVIMHGQIVHVGGTFSNGLAYPGDQSGPIEEWILCRCQVVPFLMPEGLTAPSGEDYFYESDLVVLGSEPTAPEEVQQPAAQVTEPKEIPIAKNIKEAEQLARDFGICDNVDFKGVPLDVANEVNKVVYGYNEIAPNALSKIDQYGTVQSVYKAFDTEAHEALIKDILRQNPKLTEAAARAYYKLKITRVDPGVIAARVQYPGLNRVGLGVNTHVVSKSGFQNMLDSMVNSGYSPVGCNTVKSVTDHEMAHMIGYAYDMHDTRYLKDPVLKALYAQLDTKTVESGLSKYATKNGKEFIAEAWAEYKNNPAPRDIAVKVGKRMEQIISSYHNTNTGVP